MAIVGENLPNEQRDAQILREQMECKNTLAMKGALYVGTGAVTPVPAVGARPQTDVAKTTSIAPNGGTDDGKVLIADSTKNEGWRIDKIGPTNITPKSLTGDQLADGAIGNSKLAITDQIIISPLYTNQAAKYPTVISSYSAPYGNYKTTLIKLPRYSGTLVTEDDVEQDYLKRDLITREQTGDYRLPDGTIVGLNGIDITLQFIGSEHMEGGDTAGVVTNVVKAENGVAWEGSVKSWDSSGKIVLNLKDSTQMLTRLPWDIQVTYYQSAYSAINAENATNAENTSFSNGTWQVMTNVQDDRYLEKNTFYYIKFKYNDFLYSGIIYTDCPSGVDQHLIWSSYGENPGDKTERGLICLFTTDEGDAQKCKIDGAINAVYNLFDSVTSIDYLKIR